MLEPSSLLLREAESTDDDSYDSASEDEFYNGEDNPYKRRVFEKFSELPPELRLKVWEFGLAGAQRPRVLQFDLAVTTHVMHGEYTTNEFGDEVPCLYKDWHIYRGDNLAHETELTRNIMAVSREARSLARKILPHTLDFQNSARGAYGMVYFNRDRDVVHVSGFDEGHTDPGYIDESVENNYYLDGFAENIVQLAVDCHDFDDHGSGTDTDGYFNHAVEPFHNLKRLFLISKPRMHLAGHEKLWCGSDFVYIHTTAIKDRGNGYFLIKRCWPNADDYDDFARNQIPTPTIPGLPSQGRPLLSTRGIVLLPMVVFEDEAALAALEKLRARWQKSYMQGISIEELSDSSSDADGDSGPDSESEPDEYESEGIDDSEIVENGGEDDGDEDNMSGDEIYDDVLDGDGVGEVVPVFSSPEPEPNSHGGSTSGVQNSRKRRIVSDSDDEAPSEGSRTKRARTGRFPARVITSDTEDDEVSNPNGAGRRRRRAAVVDSDDEDGDDGGGDGINGGLDKHESNSGKEKGEGGNEGRSNNNDQEDEDEDEDEDDEDEEEEEEEEEEEVLDVRRLSLATRLELVTPRHPSSLKRKPEDEVAITDAEDEDQSTIVDPEDYDDDDEDEDEERSEDDLIDGIAEESDMSDFS